MGLYLQDRWYWKHTAQAMKCTECPNDRNFMVHNDTGTDTVVFCSERCLIHAARRQKPVIDRFIEGISPSDEVDSIMNRFYKLGRPEAMLNYKTQLTLSN